jgi:hypothetical protein
MKTRNLILLGAAAIAAITINATASDALLSPRAAGNQIQHVSGTANDVKLVNSTGTTVSPRAAGNQTVTVAGQSNDVTPAFACAKNMNGTPKAVQACLESGTMSGCKTVAVAALK